MVVAVAFLFRTAMRRIQTSGRQWLGGDRGARVSTNVSCPIRPIRRRTIQVLLVMHATLGNDRPTSVHIPITATRSRRMHEAGPGSMRRKSFVDRPPRARSWPASDCQRSLRQGQDVSSSAIILDIQSGRRIFSRIREAGWYSPWSRGDWASKVNTSLNLPFCAHTVELVFKTTSTA